MQIYEYVNKMILVAAPVGVVRLAQSDVSYVVVCCEVNGRGEWTESGKKNKGADCLVTFEVKTEGRPEKQI